MLKNLPLIIISLVLCLATSNLIYAADSEVGAKDTKDLELTDDAKPEKKEVTFLEKNYSYIKYRYFGYIFKNTRAQ